MPFRMNTRTNLHYFTIADIIDISPLASAKKQHLEESISLDLHVRMPNLIAELNVFIA